MNGKHWLPTIILKARPTSSLKSASSLLARSHRNLNPGLCTTLHCTLSQRVNRFPSPRPSDRPTDRATRSLFQLLPFSPLLPLTHSIARHSWARAPVFVRTAIRGAARRLFAPSVCPSVRPSVPSFRSDETERITSGIIARIAAEVTGPPTPPPVTFPN